MKKYVHLKSSLKTEHPDKTPEDGTEPKRMIYCRKVLVKKSI